MTMRTIECNTCGEPLAAAKDEELLGRLRGQSRPSTPTPGGTSRRRARRSPSRPTTPLITDGRGRWGVARRHEVVVVRHGETEWSLSGRHTGRTDLPLTERGEARARELASRFAGRSFSLVLAARCCVRARRASSPG